MRAELAGVEPDASNPVGDKARVLPCRHALVRRSPAAEQEFAWPLARSAKMLVNRLPGLLGHLEPDRLARLLLAHSRSIDGISVRGNVLHLERDDIAAAQLAIDGQVEHRQLAGSPLDLQLGA